MYVVCFRLLYRYRRKIGGKRLAEIPLDAEAMLGGFFWIFFFPFEERYPAPATALATHRTYAIPHRNTTYNWL